MTSRRLKQKEIRNIFWRFAAAKTETEIATIHTLRQHCDLKHYFPSIYKWASDKQSMILSLSWCNMDLNWLSIQFRCPITWESDIGNCYRIGRPGGQTLCWQKFSTSISRRDMLYIERCIYCAVVLKRHQNNGLRREAGRVSNEHWKSVNWKMHY
jgi:hypothetical protein